MESPVNFRVPPALPGPLLSATSPLTQEQVVVLLEEALQWWDEWWDFEGFAAAVHAFVSRFEATWGPLTLATLLRVAHHFAPNQVAGRREPATATMPPDLPLLVEVVGTDTFVVAAEIQVALVGLGFALHQQQQQEDGRQPQQPHRRRGQPQPSPQHQGQQRQPQGPGQGHGPSDGRRTEAADVLATYLDSPRLRERWLSAEWLGRLRDLRALPVLTRMLTEYLPPHDVRDGGGDRVDFYDPSSRSDLAPLIWHLREVGGVGLATALRQALLAALAVEQAIPRPSGPLLEWSLPDWHEPDPAPAPASDSDLASDSATARAGQRQRQQRRRAPEPYRYTGQAAVQRYHDQCKPWINYQHQLVYGLGWLGAFGALMGVPTLEGIYGSAWVSRGDPSTAQLTNAEAAEHADRFRGNLWRVEACCGFLEADYCARVDPSALRFADVPAFAQAVERLLEEQFGLTEAERRQAMEDYRGAGYFYQVKRYYQHVARERAERQQPPAPSATSKVEPVDGDQLLGG